MSPDAAGLVGCGGCQREVSWAVDVSEPNEGRRWQFLSGFGDQVRARRWHRMLLLSALTGAVTGLAVAGFEWLTARTLLDWVFGLPRAAQVLAPGIGLVLAW